jgi:hypothetical protein
MIPKTCSITMRAVLLVRVASLALIGATANPMYGENGAGVRVERSQTRPTLTHACPPKEAVLVIRGLPL